MKRALIILPAIAVTGAFAYLLVSSGISTAQAQSPAKAAKFEVDPIHSAVVFRIRYANSSTFFGRFNNVSGTFSVDESNLEKCVFDLKVKTASIDTGNKQRDGHLSSPDFFSAKQYPEISFVSKSVKKVKNRTLKVTGDLTLRGVTKSVVADVTYSGQAKDARGGTRAGFDGQLTIRRGDFGIISGKGMLGEEVTIEMGLTGLKK